MSEILRDFKFVVEDHDKLSDTINAVVNDDTCHFCKSSPIVIVYRGWDDKVVAACEKHAEIVEEMIERAQHVAV